MANTACGGMFLAHKMVTTKLDVVSYWFGGTLALNMYSAPNVNWRTAEKPMWTQEMTRED